MKFLAASVVFISAMFTGNAHASLVSIGAAALLGDAITTGFEGCATGVAATAACTGLPIADISAAGGSSNTGDTVSSGFNGNSVARQGSAVVVVAPGDAIDDLGNLGGFHVAVTGTITQFAFRLVDQTNINVRVLASSGDGVDFLESSAFPNDIRYFESSVSISWFEVLCNESSCGGFSLDDVSVAGIAAPVAVPEPGTLGLMLIALFGLNAVRRNP